VEEFANVAGDQGSIARFTRKYGPLDVSPQEGTEFVVQMQGWMSCQAWVRHSWSQLSNMKTISWQRIVDPRDQLAFDFAGRRLIYHAATLKDYLELDLLSLPHDRLKVCVLQGCPHPYFLARHLRQKYCSEPCAWRGLRKAKLDWYYRKTGRRKQIRKRNIGE
jgi:hypothetical protein